MAAYIQRPDNTYLFFDLTDEEQHEGTALVTEYPVEEGPDVSDHVRVQLDRFTLQCTITNTPLFGDVYGGSQQTVSVPVKKFKPPPAPTPGFVTGAIEGAVSSLLFGGDPTEYNASVLQFPTPFDAVEDAHHTLRAMQQGAELLTVVTSKMAYEKVVLENFVLVRNANTGTGAEVSLRFKQIQTVKVKTGLAPTPTEPRGQAPVVNKGAKSAKPADPGQIKAVDSYWFDKIFGG